MSGRQATRLGLAAAAALVLLAGQRHAEARSTFVVNNLDAPGSGFNDPTPAAPVGGNPGTTVGAQRLAAFREATNIWAAALDSRVPVVIDARFGPLACTASRITLGQAGATALVADRPGLPPGVYIPMPLADRLAEMDLLPGEADIDATFNGNLLQCSSGRQDWYYGLDGKPPGDEVDLLSVVLHELCHGLGFASAVDDDTGELPGGLIDSFGAHLFDNGAGRAWMAMSNAERAASARNFRHLVWNGENVARVAPLVLDKGAPRLRVTPMPAGFRGALGEANFGPFLTAGAVTGALRIGTPVNGCEVPPNYNDAIVLFQGGGCPSAQKAALAETGGAAAVLISDPQGLSPPSSVDVPPDQESMFPVHVPVVGITIADANLLIAAGSSASVTLDAEAARPVGLDEQGRMYLYASDPILPGSTVSHWDPIARPNLMQEPNSSYDVSHDIRLEVALLRDIGWTPFCGNGRLDPEEACDNGKNNSDTTPGACRTTCVSARCGDAVADPGEACDNGASNSDTTPGACRSTCVAAACGDMVMDPGETCDDGTSNSDTTPGACRALCLKAACGDGVVDPDEECDDGTKNAAGAACTPECKRPPADKGCGCAVGSGASAWGAPAGLLAALLLAATRRRRRL
jgi:MYXO-CTERM domain-containing protein